MVDSLEVDQSSNANNELRELDAYDFVCGQPFRLFRRNWKCFFTITFLATGVEALLEMLFLMFTGGQFSMFFMGSGTNIQFSNNYILDEDQKKHLRISTNLSHHDPGVVFMIIANTLIVYMMACLAKGAVVQIVAERYAEPAIVNAGHAQSTFSAVVGGLGSAGRKGVPLITTCLCVSLIRQTWSYLVGSPNYSIHTWTNGRVLGVYVAFTSLLGMFVTLFTYFMVPSVVVESKNALESIKSSLLLQKGSVLSIFAVLLVYKVMMGVVNGVVMPSLLWPAYETTLGIISIWILNYVIKALFLAINTVVATVIYFHLRVKSEQLDPETLAVQLGLKSSHSYSNMKDDKNTEAVGASGELV